MAVSTVRSVDALLSKARQRKPGTAELSIERKPGVPAVVRVRLLGPAGGEGKLRGAITADIRDAEDLAREVALGFTLLGWTVTRETPPRPPASPNTRHPECSDAHARVLQAAADGDGFNVRHGRPPNLDRHVIKDCVTRGWLDAETGHGVITEAGRDALGNRKVHPRLIAKAQARDAAAARDAEREDRRRRREAAGP